MSKRSSIGTCLTVNALYDNAQTSVFPFIIIAVDHFLV